MIQQSRIAETPAGNSYYIGDRLPLPRDVKRFAAGGYIAVRPDAGVGARVRILELWECHACGRHINVCAWVFQDQVLTATEAVDLTGAAILHADFLTEDMPEDSLVRELQRGHPDYANDIQHFSLRDVIHMLVTGDMVDDDN